MQAYRSRAALPCAVATALAFAATPLWGQHMDHDTAAPPPDHETWSVDLGAGWTLLGMAQAFPIITIGAPGEDDGPLRETEPYLTQPAIMVNLEGPGSRLVLRTTLNFEGVTLEEGEFTFGGWGEGFIDKRHPHTLLHELMLSLNLPGVGGGEVSLSAGKGFAPYGTDDPMARPALKYPTNHHLSQILERWTVNGVFLKDGWSAEAGFFGGTEPEGPYDLSNIESFPDSWSARVAKRWGGGTGPAAAWEASGSLANVVESHDGEDEATHLWNLALRHQRTYGFGPLYALGEFSRGDPEHGKGFYSALAETRLEIGRHQPYARVEVATRPEYPRDGTPGTDAFFRYDHDAEAIGATRWIIATLGYGFEATSGAVSLRPFVDAQLHDVALERGGAALEPETLFDTDRFWTVSLGVRIFLGGDPMRMGSYGLLDPMTAMRRMMEPGEPMEMDPPLESRR